MMPSPSEIIAVVALAGTIISVYLTYRKSSMTYVNRKVDWEVTQERRISRIETAVEKMGPVNDRIVALETQMAPLWRIVEDSVLKSLIHNPLTQDERAALSRYHTNRHNPHWFNKDDLIKAKLGLQRELKELEESKEVPTESTLPYVLAIAAIDRRLAGGTG